MRLIALLLATLFVATACGGEDQQPRSNGRIEFRVVAASGKGAPTVPPEDKYAGVPADVSSQFAAGVTCKDWKPSVDVHTEEAMVACGTKDKPYLLGKQQFIATVRSAEAKNNGVQWAVDIELHKYAAQQLADLTRELAGTERELAVVSDGQVIIAPVVRTPITDGKLQIAGTFDKEYAEALARRLER